MESVDYSEISTNCEERGVILQSLYFIVEHGRVSISFATSKNRDPTPNRQEMTLISNVFELKS